MSNRKVSTVKLHDAATTTATSSVHEPIGPYKTFQATGTTSAGAGAATIVIEVSNDGVTYATLDTLSLTLSTTSSTDIGLSADAYRYYRARISAISGTDATVTTTLGCFSY